MHYILRIALLSLAVALTARLVPGFYVSGDWLTFVLVAIFWGALVSFVRPVLRILTLPITILTLGLFSFVLNAILLYAVSIVVPGFALTSIWSAIIGAFVLSIFTWGIDEIV